MPRCANTKHRNKKTGECESFVKKTSKKVRIGKMKNNSSLNKSIKTKKGKLSKSAKKFIKMADVIVDSPGFLTEFKKTVRKLAKDSLPKYNITIYSETSDGKRKKIKQIRNQNVYGMYKSLYMNSDNEQWIKDGIKSYFSQDSIYFEKPTDTSSVPDIVDIMVWYMKFRIRYQNQHVDYQPV